MSQNYLFLIAIDEYNQELSGWKPLQYAVSDAQHIKDILVKKYNYKLYAELINSDATRKNILNTFQDLCTNINEQDNVIIYFAGHGHLDKSIAETNIGYWIPIDANIDNRISDYIPNSQIKDFIGALKAKHIFLIVDACFSGSFFTRTRGGESIDNQERTYIKLQQNKSRWALTSGREEKVADAMKGETTSPFAKYLIKLLVENTKKYLAVVEVIEYVVINTGNNSNQQPMGESIHTVRHEGGQLVLVNNNFSETAGVVEEVEIQKERDRGDINNLPIYGV